jgi:aryl-alcohol dehydrogenase-like predicted oxidoreductase
MPLVFIAFAGWTTAPIFARRKFMPLFTNYTFGTMSLGKEPADVVQDLAVTRRAMEAGVWFHSSPTYNSGFAYMVLRMAFDEDRARVPRLILKVRDATVPLMRFETEDSCRRLGIDAIDVAQLTSIDLRPGNIVDQLRGNGGPLVDELATLRARGLIKQVVIFISPQNSAAAVEAVRHELIDGVTFYWNACQRECSPTAWAAIRAQKIDVLALRTVGGGPADQASAAKAGELAALVKAAGCRDAAEFNVRLAATEPAVRTTIGGTASPAHLEDFLTAAKNPAPLPPEILQRVEQLQSR